MAREPRTGRQDQRSVKFGGGEPIRGHVKLHGLGRGFVCLIGAIFVVEANFVDSDPVRQDDPMTLADGEDGVGTTSLAVSAKGSLIVTTDTAGSVSLAR